MNHEIYDLGLTKSEERYLRRRRRESMPWLALIVFVMLAVVFAVLFDMFLAPTTGFANEIHKGNAYYCAHLSEHHMLDADRAKIESYCKSI